MLAGVGEFFRSPKGPVIIYGEGGGGGQGKICVNFRKDPLSRPENG